VTALLIAAFAAGMVSTVNPCGFAMLPAYMGIFIGERASTRRSALGVGASVSLGFVSVFAVAGLLVASGVRFVIGWIPWIAALVGVGLIAVGVAELRGTHILIRIPGARRAPGDHSFRGLVGFGASYGVASLSCTLPIFLSLIAGAVAGRSLLESLAVFLSYGAGMSLVVISLTLGLAAGRDRLLRAVRPLGAKLGVISGWVLILAGGFIVWYWATVLSSGGTALSANPVVRSIEQFAATVAGLVAASPARAALAIVLLGAGGWLLSHRSGRRIDDQIVEHKERTEVSS
jgi:cytochrome c-type biogenesis protein